ncbi:WD40-repeat-containing domain protein [Chlamydoabsidia padenii]|nr:WD40-repeat-containing domain protein [Chlamydoabsidia padenii]
MSTPSDYLFAAFDQNTETQYFATVTQSIERHRLRIYSVESNKLTHDYELKNGESVTSLSWGHVLVNQPEDLKEKKKQQKKSKAKKTSSLDKVVLLGTDKGSILLYSVEQNKVTKTVPSNEQVVDALLNDLGTTIYFLSTTGTLIAWSLENDQPVSEWNTKLKDAHKLALDHDASLLAVAGEGKVELWDLVKGKIVKTVKSSDKHSNINHLVFGKHNHILISDGKNTIDSWDTKENGTKSTQSLLVDEGVQHIDLISTKEELMLLVVTTKGTAYVWKSDQSGATKWKLITTVKVMASKTDQVPILWANFTKLQNQHAIAIVRGSSAKPVLEALSITDDKNKALHDIVLTRQTAGVASANNNNNSNNNTESDNEDMEIDSTLQHTPETLVKALQSENKTAIIAYVEQTTELEQIDNTVRQLPIAHTHQMTLVLVGVLESKPLNESTVVMLWLKRVVSFHYRHLIDDHLLIQKLASLSRVLTIHATETLPKVIALRGRVEMIRQQLDLQSKRAQLEEEDASLALEPIDDSDDEDSDDEDSDNDDDLDDDLDDFEEDSNGEVSSGHRQIKDEDMFMEEMAEDDDDIVESDIDDSDASM